MPLDVTRVCNYHKFGNLREASAQQLIAFLEYNNCKARIGSMRKADVVNRTLELFAFLDKNCKAGIGGMQNFELIDRHGLAGANTNDVGSVVSADLGVVPVPPSRMQETAENEVNTF